MEEAKKQLNKKKIEEREEDKRALESYSHLLEQEEQDRVNQIK